MFKPHFGICVCHGLKRLIVVKKGYCDEGNRQSKGVGKAVQQKLQKNKKIQYRRKPTGELEVFKEIWEERPQVSQISGEPLPEFSVYWFSHILGKQAYPRFRKLKKNIVLKTKDEHDLWTYQRHKINNDPKWKWVLELEQELKREYYAKADNQIVQ